MDDDAGVLQRVELALAQAKRIRRESNISVTQLARLRDHLQPAGAQGEENDNSSQEE